MNLIFLFIFFTLILLFLIIFLIFKLFNKSDKKVVKQKIKKEILDFEDLLEIVKNPNSDSKKLLEVLTYFNENFEITDEKKYFIFLSRILTHPNRDKNLFHYFHKFIKPKYKEFKEKLDSIEEKALG